MSVDSYLGKASGSLRLTGAGLGADRVMGDVLEGLRNVEDAQRLVDLQARKAGENCGSVRGYDPVLRSHCRLDREG